MPKVKSGVAEKWARVTPQRTADYEHGVKNPRNPWAASTLKSAPNYEAGIQKSIAEKRFAKGVAKAGDAKWQEGAIVKGTARFGPGVQAAEANYASGIAPYLQVIESTTLPPRYPKGDPRNIDRVKVISQALRKKKESS